LFCSIIGKLYDIYSGKRRVIDSEGFRANVGIILTNDLGRVFWARRLGMDAWQFPQGGIKKDEPPKLAMYRELKEETGLDKKHVEIIDFTDNWLKYWLPKRFIRHNTYPLCIGQKQIWYLLKLVVDESYVNLTYSDEPEFDKWKWVDLCDPINEVVSFKRNVYEEAIKQFAPFIITTGFRKKY
jgi:putative (di)nucleoside polyphosphate hydrolase|tara:strand:- start:42 stop:590 length:549 start_codon:yes stop_codon:yes gene_type:complete